MLDDPLPIDDSFPDEQLAALNVAHNTPRYANYANYIVSKYLPPSFTYQQKKKFFYDLRHNFWDDSHLYKEGVDGIIRRCLPKHEQGQILRNVPRKLMEGIMPEIELPTRYCNLDFIGLLSSRMPVSSSYLVMNVKE